MDVEKHCPGHGLGWGNSYSKKHGYTLIELLVTLAITSILALNIYPNLSNLIARERSTILTNTLAGALAYARSEAIKRNTTILACQSNNGSECNKSENWHNGWIIFTDTNKNKQRDPEETLLRVYAAANNSTQATFSGSSSIKHYVKYKASGRALPNGSFLICNSNIGVGKALIIASSGRVRLSKTQTNGSTINCN
jgi:type IV fimbrial biogenesis protein FimT